MTTYAIAATGTGGHVFPAAAIAEALLARGDTVVWFGVESGLECSLPYQHIALPVGPVVGQTGKFKKLVRLLSAIPIAIKALANVDKAIVFGGYISVPVGLAAWLKGLPLYIQEQNAYPGRANRLLKPFSKLIFTAYPGVFAEQKTLLFGNPLRFTKAWIKPNKVLVFGGSLGSAALSKVMLSVVQSMPEIEFKIVLGKDKFEQFLPLFAEFNNVQLFDFIEDMAAAYAWADAVIARAGALTIAECKAFNLHMLLIPLPNSADNHQLYNAKYSECCYLLQPKALDILAWLNSGDKTAVEKILAYI